MRETRRVYRNNNVELPRTSREQSFIGLAVGFPIMQPGDLVFFDTSKYRKFAWSDPRVNYSPGG